MTDTTTINPISVSLLRKEVDTKEVSVPQQHNHQHQYQQQQMSNNALPHHRDVPPSNISTTGSTTRIITTAIAVSTP